MKQKLIIVLLSVLIVVIIAATIILTRSRKKQQESLPLPNGVEVQDTIRGRAVYADSLSDLLHLKENAYIIRRGYVDPKTKQFIKPPAVKLLDENKNPILKVRAVL